MSWSEPQLGRVSRIRDLTRGRWPLMCQTRSPMVQQRPGSAVMVRFTCTRIAGHTGRHAAGSHGRVVAVWVGGH